MIINRLQALFYFRPKWWLQPKEAEKKIILAESYYKQGDMTVNKIDSEIGVLKMTFYKYIRHRKVKIGSYVHQNDSKSQVVDIQ